MTPEQRETLGKALEYSQSYVEGFAADAAWVMAHGSADAPAMLATKAFHHARLADALRAALAPPPTCGTWQPIETAPKMRKVIVHYLNALGKHRTVMACYYLANALEMDDDYAEVGTYDEVTGNSYAPEGWYEEHDSDNPIMRLEGDPDSWMPLPDLPTEPTR